MKKRTRLKARPAQAPPELTEREERYARERAMGKKKRAAALAAGFDSARAHAGVTSAEIERKPAVQARIKDLIEKDLPLTEVSKRAAEHVRIDMADFVTLVEIPSLAAAAKALAKMKAHEAAAKQIAKIARIGYVIDVPKAIAAGKSHLIKKLGFDKFGQPKIELVDGQGALKFAAELHGAVKQRVEHTGPDGKPIRVTTTDLTGLTDEQLSTIETVHHLMQGKRDGALAPEP